MSTVAYVLLGLAAAMALIQFWAIWSARRLQGRPAPEYGELVPPGLAGAPRLLFYFYGERCGPCRALVPLIERLAKAHPTLVKVDVARYPEAARRFQIMGTPSFVLVEQGRIAKAIVGAATERVLTDMLERSIDKS